MSCPHRALIGDNMEVNYEHVTHARKAQCTRMLTFLRRIATRENIEVRKIDFHPRHRPDCFDAETDFDEKSITFCGSIDRITVLHELAHLAVDQPHTRAWAERLLELHQEYLPPDVRRRADRSIALNYGKGATAYYRKYRKRVLRNIKTIRSE